MKEITDTLTKQPKGDLTKALVDLVKIFENDSGGNSQILNVIKQVVNDAVTKDKTSNTGQGKDAKTVIVKKIIETPKPKPTTKASNDPSIKSTNPSQPSKDPNFIRLPPNTKFLPTLDGTFSTHVLLPTGMIATFPISAIKTGPDGSLGIVLPTTKISNVPQSGFSDLGKLQGVTDDLPADLSSFSVPDNVIPNSASITSTLPVESPAPPVGDAITTATTEIPSEPKSVVDDTTAASSEILSEPPVGDTTAASSEIPSEPIIDDDAASALEIPSEPKSIVDDNTITDVSSESEDNDVNQVKAEEEESEDNDVNQVKAEEEESEDNDVNQVKAEEEESEDNDVNQVKAEEEESEDNDVNQVKAEEEESEDNDVNQVKAEEEEEESEDNDVNQINQVKAGRKKKKNLKIMM